MKTQTNNIETKAKERLIIEFNKKYGYVKYDNKRYIETIDNYKLDIINEILDTLINVEFEGKLFENKLGAFKVQIEIKTLKGIKTKIISCEYEGIYADQHIII